MTIRYRRRIDRKIARSPFAVLRLKARQAAAALTGMDRAWYRAELPLLCVVTGLPNTGTTVLSQLLNAHPRVAGGFELGALLRDVVDFDRAQPFYERLLSEEGPGWALTEEDRAWLLGAVDHHELYWRLNRVKGRAHRSPALRRAFETADLIFDKMPRYVYRLPRYVAMVERPFFVTFKSPEESLASARKRDQDLGYVFYRYERAVRQIDRALDLFPQRVHVVRYRDLASEPERVMARVAEIVGFDDGRPLTLEWFRVRIGEEATISGAVRTEGISYARPPAPDDAGRRAIDEAMQRNRRMLDRITAAAI